MKKKIYSSDLKLMLKLFSPKKYNLFIFDPELLLIRDENFVVYSGEGSPKILINLSDEVICYKDLKLDDFSMVFDFGKSKFSNLFKQKTFLFINNKNGSMRWLYQQKNLLSVLSFYNTSSLRSKLISLFIKTAHYFKLDSLVKSGNFTIHFKQELKIEKTLSQIPHDEYSIFTGTKGFDRMAVLALGKNNRITHFAKIALDRFGVERIINERQKLFFFNKVPFKSFITPTVIPCKDDGVLFVTNETQSDMKHPNKMKTQHFDVLHELFHETKNAHTIKNSLFWGRLLNNLSIIKKNKLSEGMERVYLLLTHLVSNINTQSTIYTSLAHSDFTPWNMKTSNDKTYLYDWEFVQSNVPFLNDLFHFHFQNGILIKNQNYNQIENEIITSCKNNKIKSILQDYGIKIKPYLRLYLLKTISYNLAIFQTQRELSLNQKKQLIVWEQAIKENISIKLDCSFRKVFINEFYSKLSVTRHALLKFSIEKLENLPDSSDLDIAIDKNNLEKIQNYIKQHRLIKKINEINKSFMSTIEIFFKDGTFLSIDLIHDFKRKHMKMMNIEPLLKSAKLTKSGVMVPNKKYDLEYAFLFYSLNNESIPQKYYSYFGLNDYKERELSFTYINSKYKLKINSFNELFSRNIDFKAKILQKIKHQQFYSLKNRTISTINYLIDTVKALVKSRGFIITLSGVDGAGKTTIITKVVDQIQKKYRKKIVLLRHRPRVLPILSSFRYGSSKKAENAASINLPRQGTNKNYISSILRFGYYYLDYIIGQIYIYFKYILRGKIVVFDRYYFDFITDSKRSNINLNRTFIKVLYFFILKPKVNILLWADPLVIYQRKKELEPKDLLELTLSYKNLFNEYNQHYKNSIYRSVENIDIDSTVSKIMDEFSQVA